MRLRFANLWPVGYADIIVPPPDHKAPALSLDDPASRETIGGLLGEFYVAWGESFATYHQVMGTECLNWERSRGPPTEFRPTDRCHVIV